ncbi:hypothetical protein ABIB37_000293 [Agrococcus sp. UYP10]|uniref:hypothetical protein n=1 Tax=Agrococcus sp. UYP10 TaxID=1756355 RepID=UPI00339557C8
MRRSESHSLTAIASAGAPSARSRRMLALVALTGSAALLAACASPGTSPTTAPPEPSAAGDTGAAPVALADDLLQAEGLFDEVSSEGYAVRWVEPGESIAVVIGGSGGGGGCIPQPHAAELGAVGAAVVVSFDPPDAAIACTADYRLHGWGLALPMSVPVDLPTVVELVNLRGEDETTEVRIGADNLLDAGPTADPQPSLIPEPSAEGAAPSPIPPDQLPEADVTMQDAQVRWIEPGRRLAVILGGSGVAECVPTPVAARTTGISAIAVSFEFPSEPMDCSADFHLYGWQFELEEPVSGTLPAEVTVTGTTAADSSTVLALQPDDLLSAP